jgi:uncharacterized protein (TIGR00369 family)
MTELLARAKQALATQPFSVLLGAEIVDYSSGYAELRIPIKDQLKQQHGFLHGGVVAYAADNGLAFAGGSVLGPAIISSEFKINYLRPAMGDFLVARATVVHSGKSQAVCRCDVFVLDGNGERLCATAQGTIVKMSRSSDGTA